jgi:TonB family protein
MGDAMKEKIMRSILLAAGCMLLATGAFGQDVPRSINGGVLNGKAVSLPKPEFPAEAKSAHVSGVVRVQITINEAGVVESAKAVTDDEECDQDETRSGSDRCRGLILLRDSAERAAIQARFSPTLLSGNPVKVNGLIAYNFVADRDLDDATIASEKSSLNNKAIELPDPVYPDAAKLVKASGPVTVRVTVDEAGNVVSAAAVSGHPILRAAAVTAARAARFTPTLLDGQAVKVAGTLTYNFVLPPAN